MKQLFAKLNRKFIKPTLLVLTAFVLAGQSISIAMAASPLQNNPLFVSTKTELDRRFTVMATDKTLVQNAGTGSANDALVSATNQVQNTVNTRKQSLEGATTTDQLISIAKNVDSDYAEFRAVSLAATLYADIKAQDGSIQQLRNLAQQIQDTVNAAKTNNATHVNAGVGGFVQLNLINQNIDKLKKSLTSSAIITAALSSTMTLLSSDSDLVDSSTSTTITQLYDQLSVTQNTLSDVGLGLSQLSNLITGNRTGISYCGWWSNCQGMENNGAILVCGGASNCQNSTNTSIAQSCGIFSDCSNSVNNGLFVNCGTLSVCAGSKNIGVSQRCGLLSYCADSENNGLNQKCGTLSNCANNINTGISQECGLLSNCANAQNTGISQDCGTLSNCSDSTNNGVAITCGLLSDCSKSINNAGVIQCGTLSNCSGNTNNSLLIVCGLLSNCSGSQTNTFVSICGALADCSGGTTHAFITICGLLSDCSSTILECSVNSDGEPIGNAASASLNHPLGVQSQLFNNKV
jgi:hypothetical protein